MNAGYLLVLSLLLLCLHSGEHPFSFSIIVKNTNVVQHECKYTVVATFFEHWQFDARRSLSVSRIGTLRLCQPDVHVVIIQLIKMSVITAVQFNQFTERTVQMHTIASH